MNGVLLYGCVCHITCKHSRGAAVFPGCPAYSAALNGHVSVPQGGIIGDSAGAIHVAKLDRSAREVGEIASVRYKAESQGAVARQGGGGERGIKGINGGRSARLQADKSMCQDICRMAAMPFQQACQNRV